MKDDDLLAMEAGFLKAQCGEAIVSHEDYYRAGFGTALEHRDGQGAAVYQGPDWPLYELDSVIAEQKAGRPFDATSLDTLVRVHEALAKAYNESHEQAGEADAWLVTWQDKDGQTWVHAHACEVRALDLAKHYGGVCEPRYPATSAHPAQPVQQWQPIETASKDGTEILAWFPDLGRVVASFCDYDSVNNSGGWAIGRDYYGPAPTHWAPLLAEPGEPTQPVQLVVMCEGEKDKQAIAGMLSQPVQPSASAEDYLRGKYGAYRGHFAWRELEEAFNAGRQAQPVQPAVAINERLLKALKKAEDAMTWEIGGEPCGLEDALSNARAAIAAAEAEKSKGGV